MCRVVAECGVKWVISPVFDLKMIQGGKKHYILWYKGVNEEGKLEEIIVKDINEFLRIHK